MKNLPQEPKEKEEKEPESSRESKGLVKALNALTRVLNILKNVYDKVAGGINKILGIINITTKAWFEPFSAIYAGVVTVIEKVSNPAQALSEGAEKLKEAVGGFFDNIKTKIKDISGSIKEKVMILGNPAQLMKTIANKAVDMVLNFIITHPPSALIKALFKGIEAIEGKSIVELIRQHIPYADKIFDSIASSEPVQAIMKPIEGPVNKVGGMIDQVTDEVTNMVDSAEKTTLSKIGNGAKLMQAMGIGGQGSAGASGRGEFFETIKSGVHNNLMTLGLANLKKLGTQVLQAGAAKIKTIIGNALTPKVKFKLGNEEHRLWVAKGQNRNVVMMASEEKPLDDHIQTGKVPNNGEIISDQKKAEDPKNEEKAEPHVRELAGTIQSVTSGETVKVGNDGGDKGKDKEAENSKGESNDVNPEEKQNEKAADKGTSKTEIIGKPHASTQHQNYTMNEVNKLSSTGEFSKIYINKSLKTAGFNGTQKPDIIAVGKNGNGHIVEIASPSQLSGKPWTLLNNKLITMLRNNPGMTGRVISPKY